MSAASHRSPCRYLAIGLMLLGTSCAADHDGIQFEAELNHPIKVEPQFASLDVPAAMAGETLNGEDAAHLREFAAAYVQSGNGALSIIAPAGERAAAMVRYYGERLAALGIPRSRLLAGTDPELTSVELRFIHYSANVQPCGAWDDVSRVGDNEPMSNLGCASQHNTAVMVTEPRDFIAPRPLGAPDAVKRQDTLQKYETGMPTAAQQTDKQSVQVSQ